MTNTDSLLASIRSDISDGNTVSLFNTIENLDRDELTAFFRCNEKISDVVGSLPILNAVAGIYNEIAPYIRKAFDQNEIESKQLLIGQLDTISILHVASHYPDCMSFNNQDFVIRNSENFAFWRWFRAHAPADIKIMSLEDEFGFPQAFVLPKILLSNPHDLRFYNEFCLDLQARQPAWYEDFSIEPVIRDAMIRKAIAIEEGKTLPRCPVEMKAVKHNVLIAVFVR